MKKILITALACIAGAMFVSCGDKEPSQIDYTKCDEQYLLTGQETVDFSKDRPSKVNGYQWSDGKWQLCTTIDYSYTLDGNDRTQSYSAIMNNLLDGSTTCKLFEYEYTVDGKIASSKEFGTTPQGEKVTDGMGIKYTYAGKKMTKTYGVNGKDLMSVVFTLNGKGRPVSFLIKDEGASMKADISYVKGDDSKIAAVTAKTVSEDNKLDEKIAYSYSENTTTIETDELSTKLNYAENKLASVEMTMKDGSGKTVKTSFTYNADGKQTELVTVYHGDEKSFDEGDQKYELVY